MAIPASKFRELVREIIGSLDLAACSFLNLRHEISRRLNKPLETIDRFQARVEAIVQDEVMKLQVRRQEIAMREKAHRAAEHAGKAAYHRAMACMELQIAKDLGPKVSTMRPGGPDVWEKKEAPGAEQAVSVRGNESCGKSGSSSCSSSSSSGTSSSSTSSTKKRKAKVKAKTEAKAKAKAKPERKAVAKTKAKAKAETKATEKKWKPKPKWKDPLRCTACQEEEAKAEGRLVKVSSRHWYHGRCRLAKQQAPGEAEVKLGLEPAEQDS